MVRNVNVRTNWLLSWSIVQGRLSIGSQWFVICQMKRNNIYNSHVHPGKLELHSQCLLKVWKSQLFANVSPNIAGLLCHEKEKKEKKRKRNRKRKRKRKNKNEMQIQNISSPSLCGSAKALQHKAFIYHKACCFLLQTRCCHFLAVLFHHGHL